MLGALLASDPRMRGTLLGLARRKSLKEQHAEEVAAYLFTRILEYAGAKGGAELISRLPTDDVNSIRQIAAKIDPARHGKAADSQTHLENNSSPRTNPKNQ